MARQTVGTGTITYTYDAAGSVVQKDTRVSATAPVKTEHYVDGFVYETSPGFTGLRSVPTPEGRALVVAATDTKLTYEYHLRDHLGNLRVTFRAQAVETVAGLSAEESEVEGDYPRFREVVSTRALPPGGASTAKHGTRVTAVGGYGTAAPHTDVPVAQGERVHVRLYYSTPSGTQYRPAMPEEIQRQAPAATPTALPLSLTLAPALLPAPGQSETGGRHRPAVGVQVQLAGLVSRLLGPARQRLPTPAATSAAFNPMPFPTEPARAFLTWVLYSPEHEPLSGGRRELPVVSADAQWRALSQGLDISLPAGVASRRGYLRMSLSNEGQQPVYVDSMTVRSVRDQALVSQENHYYPFGMSMTGVAVNTAPQTQISKEQYNGGSELQDELLGAENGIYSTFFRTYDPTIGRFMGVDPLADKYADESPYSFAFNDPVNFNDPYGAEPPQQLEQPIFMNGRYMNPHSIEGGREWGGSGLDYFTFLQGGVGISTGYGGNGGYYVTTTVTHEAQQLIGQFGTAPITRGTGEFWTTQTKTWVSGQEITNRVLDGLQTGLDIIGLVPVFGEAADGVNALIYFARGDNLNAGLSLAAMVPVVGVAVTGGKLLKTVLNVHHLIPNAVVKKLVTAGHLPKGWFQNGLSNLKLLPTPFYGNHPQYNKYVEGRIQEYLDAGKFDLNDMKSLSKELRQQVGNAFETYQHTGMNLNFQYKLLGN